MTKTFFQKFIVCFLAGLVTAITLVRIGWRFLNRWVPERPMLVIGLLILVTGIVYPFIWHRKKDPVPTGKDPVRTAEIFLFWTGIIRYAVALDLIMVGLQKWFNLQFNTPMAKLDLPFSSFSSEELAWAFFGYSRGYILVIGSLQILGSLLLLYNRTRLFGATVLIPVMLNIFLMDLFYHFYPGELFNAFILLTALVYLLLLDYKKLVAAFFGSNKAMPTLIFKNRLFKNAVRCSAFLIPLAMIRINPTPYKRDWFSGKYTVERVSVNGHSLAAGSCTDSVLTVIYFDQGNECVFEFNGLDRRWFGTYRYDEEKSQMIVFWHYPKNIHDTLRATLSVPGGQSAITPEPGSDLVLSGRVGNQSIEASLRKVN